MTFQFAWAGPGETVFVPEHEREDEEVFAFTLEHTEGDFATLSIDIRNPRRRYLAEGANLWMWLSEDGAPLFFGRLIAIPEDLHAESVRLSFIARPTGFDSTKRALAETLRMAPFWDPVWIVDERLEDPDSVLEARSQLWHIDRVTHALTISDINVGEDSTLPISEHDYTSLSVRFGAPPVRRVRVDAEISWEQIAAGTLDITDQLLAAFATAGSPAGVVSSYTGQGLEADWPQQGKDLKGGWRVGEVTLARAMASGRPRATRMPASARPARGCSPAPGSLSSSCQRRRRRASSPGSSARPSAQLRRRAPANRARLVRSRRRRAARLHRSRRGRRDHRLARVEESQRADRRRGAARRSPAPLVHQDRPRPALARLPRRARPSPAPGPRAPLRSRPPSRSPPASASPAG